MTSESLSEELDADEMLGDIDLEGVLIEHLQSSDEQGIGKRLGGAAGEVIGRELGRVLGEQFIDPLLSEEPAEENEEAEDEAEAETEETEDEAETEADDEELEIEDADDLIDAIDSVLQNSDNEESPEDEGSAFSDIASRDDLEELSYRELQKLAKEVDVTANLARESMTSRLVEELDLEE